MEMEPHFRNYQINHKFQEKDNGYYCWKWRKNKVKQKILFRNYSSRLARALSTIRAGRRARACSRRSVYKGAGKN